MNRFLRLICVFALVLVAATGCKFNQKSPETKMSPAMSLAVAPFTVPKEPFDLLSGYLPERVNAPAPEALAEMDYMLSQSLNATPDRNLTGASKVKASMDSTKRPSVASRLGTLQYWQSVGKSLNVAYILIPMASHWSEREGSAGGSTKPAWVIMDMYLLNVKTGGLANHFHYDYQQQALADNILDAGKFFKRHGQWVTAAVLAKEAINQGLKELGL